MQSQRILVALKLYLLVALVGGAAVLGQPGPRLGQAAFPGINGKIVFESNLDGDYELYLMNPDGSEVVQLTSNSVDDRDPAWSADGSQIAFASMRDGNFEIYSMSADGSGQQRLTNDPSRDEDPSWSPDGSRIAFVKDYEIHIMNHDGTNAAQVPNNFPFDSNPAWSPSGSKIAFDARDIYLMDADGSNVTQLTDHNNSSNTSDLVPNWSPDGSLIAFSRCVGCLFTQQEIFVIAADGTNEVQLTNNSFFDSNPSWSPDGYKIVFRTLRGGLSVEDVYIMDADGDNQLQVTTTSSQDAHPDWQPLVAVGGVAELPEVAGRPLEAEGSSGFRASVLGGVLAAVAAGALALGGAAWYARRRDR